MANYSELHQTINDNIKPNGNQQITGQVLQNVLNAIVDSLAEGYLFAGVATADGNPGSLDQNAWWLAGPGTYENYGNITVAEGKLAALMWDGEWSSSTVDVGGVIKAGTGIKLDESGAIAIDLVAGDFISIEGNKISCTLDANPFYFTDALPETPVPGTENKVYVVPNSEGTRYDLYQWDAETSAFNKVGSISFTFDPSDFVKKNEVNDVEGPTTLSGDMGYQLGLRNTTSRSVGVDFDNGAGEGKNMLQVRSKAGNPATDSYMQMLLNGGNNVLTFGPDGLAVGGPSGSNLVKLMYIIQAPDEIYWTNIGATFTISGLFNLIKSQGNAIAYGLRNPNGKTIYDAIAVYIPGADDDLQQITLQFFAAGNMCSAFVTSDDSVKVEIATIVFILDDLAGSELYSELNKVYNNKRSFIFGIRDTDSGNEKLYFGPALFRESSGAIVLFLGGNYYGITDYTIIKIQQNGDIVQASSTIRSGVPFFTAGSFTDKSISDQLQLLIQYGLEVRFTYPTDKFNTSNVISVIASKSLSTATLFYMSPFSNGAITMYKMDIDFATGAFNVTTV